MATMDKPEAPIYDSLIEEHGDVITEARNVAEETQREAATRLDFKAGGTLPFSDVPR